MPPPLLISKKRRFTTKHNTTTTTTTKDPNYYQISSTLPSCQGKEKTQGERDRERSGNQPNPPPKNKTQIQFRKKLSKTLHQPGLWRRWVLLLWRVSRGREGGGSTF
jgi:hypothetical protein